MHIMNLPSGKPVENIPNRAQGFVRLARREITVAPPTAAVAPPSTVVNVDPKHVLMEGGRNAGKYLRSRIVTGPIQATLKTPIRVTHVKDQKA